MSFIRATEEGKWEDIGDGWYVYSDGERICYLPRKKKPFIEVVMRMLDQEGSLDNEMLEEVHESLRKRLRMEE